MNILLVLSVVGVVTCVPSGPQDATVLEEGDLIMPGVRSFRDLDSSVVFPSASNNPPNDIEVVLPVFPTGPLAEEEEGFVDLPEWMDIDLDKLSMEQLSLLNNAHNLTELTSLFGLTKEQHDRLDKETTLEEEDNGIGLRAGNFIGNAIEPDAASCKPDLEVVELEAPPSTLYLPQCVRLQRCGGCCTGNLLSCQPTKTEVVTLKVMKLQKKNYGSRTHRPSGGRSRRVRRGARASFSMITQVNHLGCSCQCRVQEHHCDMKIQHYKASECACVCKNRDEESKCIMKSSHYWDRRTCSCKCRRIQDCSTGEEFSQDTCSCVRSSRNSALDSRISDSS
ncbi:unnamed protein product [Meganyctiphanes norvegica]|uniref:Platelet-derived growth factor (PDGF) family profile domain-containing protein n=1 Tax=Meganyctiphanes norvegica TaxID=48144 RepID=A0AAV2RUQ1_MEGNR